jgi:hypothetical protein
MKLQNVAGLLTACFVAVCSHPQPPPAPLNIAKQEPGTNGTVYWGLSHKYMHVMVKLCMQRLYRPNHSVVGVSSVNPTKYKVCFVETF